jgi:cytoskeletal protein CcmA (bactofilin family)/DNA-directed RNA polymerase subunit RPC12/RpoP
MPPAGKQHTVGVTCPKCGHTQPEPPTAYSTNCKKCHQHFLVQEALHPLPTPPKPALEFKQVRCFQCGAELGVPVAAASTMCKHCGSHVDLSDYHLAHTVSKNFRTHGLLVIEEKGYALNADALVGGAVIKGRFIGKLVAEGTLEIHSSAKIKGSFTAARLVLPAGHHFRWPERLSLGAADIAGELVADLQVTGTVRLKATARFFGAIEAANLVVESGAVFVGTARIGLLRARLEVAQLGGASFPPSAISGGSNDPAARPRPGYRGKK